MPWFRNSYACDCGETWEDDWSAECDDDCPACGLDCSPDDSKELPSEDCELCNGTGMQGQHDCRNCEGHGSHRLD